MESGNAFVARWLAVAPSAPSAGHFLRRRVSMWAVAAVFAGLAARQLSFVNTHAVNVLFWDQWDFYTPMFRGQGWWETFAHQHGPHREGAGLVLTRVLADLSGWNSRWDAFAVSALMIGAAALGIRLARCFDVPGHSVLLAAVPLLFLNVHQYEIFVGAANLSYAAMPMALFMAYCLCWFARDAGWRVAAISALTFLLIFTGFGLFAGLLTPPLLAAEAIQAWRSGERPHALKAALGVAASGVSWALFARGYTFQPAVPGFRFPYERPLEYLVFVGRMLGHFFGGALLSRGELAVGFSVAACLVVIAVLNGVRCMKMGVAREPRSVVLFCLASFTLLFCANCAIGRVFTGSIAPYASRYSALLIPAGLALSLQFAVLARRGVFAWVALAYTGLLVPATAFPSTYEVSGAEWYTDVRSAWKAEYLKTHDKADADRVAHFEIYPGPLGDRLTYLEEHDLNLFLDRPSP